MATFKKYILFKAICLILVLTFVSLDITYAHPLETSAVSSTLAAPSVFQQQPIGENSANLKRSMISDCDLLDLICMVAKYLLEDKLPIKHMEQVVIEEGGKVVEGVNLSEAAVKGDILSIPYDRKGVVRTIQAALKDSVAAKGLRGRKIFESNKYVIVIKELSEEKSAKKDNVSTKKKESPHREKKSAVKKRNYGHVGRATDIISFGFLSSIITAFMYAYIKTSEMLNHDWSTNIHTLSELGECFSRALNIEMLGWQVLAGAIIGLGIFFIVKEIFYGIYLKFHGIDAIPVPTKAGLTWMQSDAEGNLHPIDESGARKFKTAANAVLMSVSISVIIVDAISLSLDGSLIANHFIMPFLLGAALRSEQLPAVSKPQAKKRERASQKKIGYAQARFRKYMILASLFVWAAISVSFGWYWWNLLGIIVVPAGIASIIALERAGRGGIKLKEREQLSVNAWIDKLQSKLLPHATKKEAKVFARAKEHFFAQTYLSNRRAFFENLSVAIKYFYAIAIAWLLYSLWHLFNFASSTVVKMHALPKGPAFNVYEALRQVMNNEVMHAAFKNAKPGEGGRVAAEGSLFHMLGDANCLSVPKKVFDAVIREPDKHIAFIESQIKIGLTNYINKLDSVSVDARAAVERILNSGKTPFNIEDLRVIIFNGILPDLIIISAMVLLGIFIARYIYTHFKASAGFYVPAAMEDAAYLCRYQSRVSMELETYHEFTHLASNKTPSRGAIFTNDEYGANLVHMARALEMYNEDLLILMMSTDEYLNFRQGCLLYEAYGLERAVSMVSILARAKLSGEYRRMDIGKIPVGIREKAYGYYLGAALSGILFRHSGGDTDALWELVSGLLIKEAGEKTYKHKDDIVKIRSVLDQNLSKGPDEPKKNILKSLSLFIVNASVKLMDRIRVERARRSGLPYLARIEEGYKFVEELLKLSEYPSVVRICEEEIEYIDKRLGEIDDEYISYKNMSSHQYLEMQKRRFMSLKGNALYQSGEYEKAIDVFREVLKGIRDIDFDAEAANNSMTIAYALKEMAEREFQLHNSANHSLYTKAENIFKIIAERMFTRSVIEHKKMIKKIDMLRGRMKDLGIIPDDGPSGINTNGFEIIHNANTSQDYALIDGILNGAINKHSKARKEGITSIWPPHLSDEEIKNVIRMTLEYARDYSEELPWWPSSHLIWYLRDDDPELANSTGIAMMRVVVRNGKMITAYPKRIDTSVVKDGRNTSRFGPPGSEHAANINSEKAIYVPEGKDGINELFSDSSYFSKLKLYQRELLLWKALWRGEYIGKSRDRDGALFEIYAYNVIDEEVKGVLLKDTVFAVVNEDTREFTALTLNRPALIEDEREAGKEGLSSSGETVKSNKMDFINTGNELMSLLAELPYPEAAVMIDKLDRTLTAEEICLRVKRAIEFAEGVCDEDLSAESKTAIDFLKRNIIQFQADSAIGSLITLARRAKRENQKLIIGLETEWIPGMSERGSLQRIAISALLKEMNSLGDALRSMGLDNVEIIRGSGNQLAGAILAAKEAGNTPIKMHNIVVMASANTINSDGFASLRNADENDRPFLAGIDPTELIKLYTEFGESVSKQLYIRLTSLLYMTLELATGKEPPQSPIIVSYDKKLRILMLLLKADPIDYEVLKSNYAAEKAALQAA